MPELPEVETVKNGLEAVMTGRKIVRLEQRRLNLRWPLPDRMVERVSGAKVLRLSRRSKYILVDLSNGETIIIHLGMSGKISILVNRINTITKERNSYDHKSKYKNHDHIIFHMDNDKNIIYNDPRRFGAMDLISSSRVDSHSWLSSLGPEPLSNNFSPKYLNEILKHKNRSIKSALMDQKIVAGLGNIYVLEALFSSGISPMKRANTISHLKIDRLYLEILKVLERAISFGGTSLQDFRKVGGELGYFQNHLNVYGREGLPCKNDCSNKVERFKQNGRSSYYCKKCQI